MKKAIQNIQKDDFGNNKSLAESLADISYMVDISQLTQPKSHNQSGQRVFRDRTGIFKETAPSPGKKTIAE